MGQSKTNIYGRKYQVCIEINGVRVACFKEVSGSGLISDLIESKTGNKHSRPPLLPKIQKITLKNGTTSSSEFLEWHKTSKVSSIQKRNIVVSLWDEYDHEVARWNIINAWPSKYDAPDLNAKGNDIAIETLEITHEGITRVS